MVLTLYIFSVVSVLLFGAMGMGEALAFAPDYTKARVAAARLFRIMDHNPEIDGTALRGQTPVGYSPHPGCVLDNKHLTYWRALRITPKEQCITVTS